MPLMRAFVLFTIAALNFLAHNGQAIVIDGSMNDWGAVAALPIGRGTEPLDSPLGAVRGIRVAQDNDFVFVLIEFEEGRPFDPPEQQLNLRKGMWDDFSYVEIDANGDGRWDYKTRMVPGKRIGRNNLCILRGDLSNGGPMALQAEGNKDYLPLGPRAFFIRGGEAVEQRIPRRPLGLNTGRLYLRVSVTYRDEQRGSGNWTTAYYPERGQWVGLDLAPSPPPEIAGSLPSVNRAMEPVMVRDDLGVVRSSPSQRLMSHYIYPIATPAPFVPQAARRAAEAAKEAEPPRTQPAIVVGPSGEVIDPATGLPFGQQPAELEIFNLLPGLAPEPGSPGGAPPAASALPPTQSSPSSPPPAPSNSAPGPSAPPAQTPAPTPAPVVPPSQP